MTDSPLTPRQRECLRLVYERQATSKEIAVALGISKNTVDGHITEAVAQLGVRNRREAAALLYEGTPRAVSGGDSARVGDRAGLAPSPAPSRVSRRWPWRSAGQPNAMALGQTLLWIVAIAVGSICVLSLAISVGNGVKPLAAPVLHAFDRLIR